MATDFKMRVLHLFDHSIPLQSGYTFRSRAIIAEQRNRGWETLHLTTPRHIKAGPDPEQVDGLTFYRTRKPDGLLSRLPLLSLRAEVNATAARLGALIREFRPDILHAHSPALNAMAALKASRAHKVPVVYEIRGTWEDAAVANGTQKENGLRYRMSRALETYAIKRVGALCVICEGLRTEMLSRGARPDRLAVIPNAVDVDRFRPIVARDKALERELGLEGKDVLGFIGSFYDYEGLDTLVSAAALLVHQRPSLRVLLVGGGPRENALAEQIRSAGLQDHVLMIGRVPNADVERYYSVIDLLVFPRKRTRVTDLVTPLKPLEAMALGRVVLASDVGGHREMIRPGETGELFAADQPQSIADVVLRMLAQRESWPRYQASGLEYVQTERTWKKSVGNYVKIYEDLLRK